MCVCVCVCVCVCIRHSRASLFLCSLYGCSCLRCMPSYSDTPTHPVCYNNHSCSGPEGMSVPMFVIRKRRQITAMRNMLQPATAPLQATDGPFLSRCVVSFSFMVCSGHHVSLRLLSLLRVMNISPSPTKKIKINKK